MRNEATPETEFYINKVREINESFRNETGRQKTAQITTFGCQMNVHDSEKLSARLSAMGYEITEAGEKGSYADVVIFNTCTVRENAENKLFGNLGMLKGKFKGKAMTVAVCGCMAQQESAVEKIRNSYRNVDIIFGTFNLHLFPRLLYDHLTTGGTVIDIWKEAGDEYGGTEAAHSEKFKAYINIMYGCENYCSYCIVPYVRGRERSRPAREILAEAKALAADGVREVTLLGQNVNSYGNGGFADLIRRINGTDGIERIRFMTSHPKDLSDELIKAMKECEKVCSHLHLPFQSGSDKILGLMNRKYTKADYLSLAEKLKEEIAGISLTTDIIVGFPGEDESDFQHTLDVVEKARFSMAYTFVYSKRPHTPAAKFPQTSTGDEIKDRFDRLVLRLNGIAAQINKNLEGSTLDVLIESFDPKTGVMTGRTPGNSITHITPVSVNPQEMPGKTAPVLITGSKTFYLYGCL